MLAMYDEIVEFAELERFMDQKLKNYSSGMQVRLAFSIAIRANTEILVLDEVLAVGDAAFQQKCNDYFEKLKQNNKTIILVTHDMQAVKNFCSRAVLIENGEIKLEGSPDTVANQYLLDNYNPSHLSFKQNQELSPFVKSLDVKVVSAKRLKNSENFEFDIFYELNVEVPVFLGIGIKYRGVPIIEHNSLAKKINNKKGVKQTVRYSLPLSGFSESKLEVDVAIFKVEDKQLIGYKTDACEFFVTDKRQYQGGAMLTHGLWKLEK
jgi:ABC-2 type transport system ATP-binding protein